MSFVAKCLIAPLQFVFGRILLAEKLATNPLYSEKLYEPANTAPSRGVYNFYVLSLVVFCLISWAGGLSWAFCLLLIVSVLVAMIVDPMEWRQKLSPADMPRQVWYYLRLLLQVLKTDLLVLLVATALVYGMVKPYTRQFDVFDGYTLYALYGLYLAIRTIVFVRYLWIVALRWETYRSPPFEIRKANLRSRGAALRHLTWSYFLGNVGLVVRCGYYSMIVYTYDRFYSFVGYPNLNGVWGIVLVVLTVGLWVLLADMRLLNTYYKAHRALHENPALYASIHRLHHCAVYPTVLDSGTINPAEFLVTESTTIWFAPFADWFWFTFQIWAVILHFTGHHTIAAGDDREKDFQFHVLHHRLYQCNFGFPETDEKYQTLLTWSEFVASEEQEQAPSTTV